MSVTEEICGLARSLGCSVKIGEELKNHTTFKIGGRCDALIGLQGEESYRKLIPLAESLGVHYYIFGKGSNLIVDSDGISGIVFQSGKGHSKITADMNVLTCGAGATLTAICNFALERGLSGMEFAYGIPGTLGGAVFMNAGAYGGEMKQVVQTVRSMDKKTGEIRVYLKNELDFSYRHSRFMESGEIILSADIELEKFKEEEGGKAAIKAKMDELMEKRRSKQPLEYPSAGSTFKRPEGSYASLLIEQCGLKGVHVGDAEVSTKHSGFIINKGNASFAELMELIRVVKDTVKEKTGYALECEPLIITDKKQF